MSLSATRNLLFLCFSFFFFFPEAATATLFVGTFDGRTDGRQTDRMPEIVSIDINFGDGRRRLRLLRRRHRRRRRQHLSLAIEP